MSFFKKVLDTDDILVIPFRMCRAKGTAQALYKGIDGISNIFKRCLVIEISISASRVGTPPGRRRRISTMTRRVTAAVVRRNVVK